MTENSFLLLEGDFSGYLLLEGDFSGNLILETSFIPPTPIDVLTPNGGARREYRPYYYELQNRRKIERKLEEAEIDLRVIENKIEALELKRTRDLANESMQEEILALLTQQNELIRIINELQQQKLMVLRDDDDFVAILMYLN